MSDPSELWPPDPIYYITENDDWSALEGRDKVTFDLSSSKYNIRPELVRPKKKIRSPSPDPPDGGGVLGQAEHLPENTALEQSPGAEPWQSDEGHTVSTQLDEVEENVIASLFHGLRNRSPRRRTAT